jgi:hypothetical protein
MKGEEPQTYHRIGEPGGPGAEVIAARIAIRAEDGSLHAAHLLDAQADATEVQLLRTICSTLGVNWGHDDLGWWATVPDRLTDTTSP